MQINRFISEKQATSKMTVFDQRNQGVTQSFTHVITHPLCHSPIHSPTHPFTHSPTHSLASLLLTSLFLHPSKRRHTQSFLPPGSDEQIMNRIAQWRRRKTKTRSRWLSRRTWKKAAIRITFCHVAPDPTRLNYDPHDVGRQVRWVGNWVEWI